MPTYSIRDLINQTIYLNTYWANAPQKPHKKEPKPEPPEFHFSDRCTYAGPVIPPTHGTKTRMLLKPVPNTAPSMPIHINQCSHGGPKQVSKAQELWNRYETVFESTPKENNLTPVGTAPTLEGLQHYLKRMDDYEAEWKAIAATQHLELATVGQELAQTGVTSYSLQTNYRENDDDIASYEEAAHGVSGSELVPDEDFVNRIRRIEWEQATLQNGPVIRIHLTVNEQGALEAIANGAVPDKDMSRYARILYANLKSKTREEWTDTEARIAYYDGCVGSACHGIGRKDGVHPETSSNYDDLGAEDLEENESNGGPAELGLHNVSGATALYEPQPEDLWPSDMDATQIHTAKDWDQFWAQIGWATHLHRFETGQSLWGFDL